MGEVQQVSMADRIREAVASGEIVLPPLPEVAVRLQKIFADPENADIKEVSELIQNEPAMSATVLKFANSAAFGGLNRITDMRQALARLGLPRINSVVTATALKGHFNSNSAEKQKLLSMLWDRSIMCATGARYLAQRVQRDPEESFLAGLLHDIGKALVLKAVDDLEAADGVEVSSHLLGELMQHLHAELAYNTLTKWKLPEPICDSIREDVERTPNEGLPALRTVVLAAVVVCRKMGFNPGADPDINLLDEAAVDELGLTDLDVATLIVDLEDEYEKLSSSLKS